LLSTRQLDPVQDNVWESQGPNGEDTEIWESK